MGRQFALHVLVWHLIAAPGCLAAGTADGHNDLPLASLSDDGTRDDVQGESVDLREDSGAESPLEIHMHTSGIHQGVSLRFDYFIGICLAVLATVAGTCGKQSIRLSELRKQDGHEEYSNMLLCGGIFTNTISGPALDMIAYAFAPQAVLAPFTGMDIVWNTLVAPYTLGEERTKRRCVAATLVFIGTTGSVLFNVPREPTWDSAYLRETFTARSTIVYFFVYIIWFVWGNWRLGCLKQTSTLRGFYYGAIAGSLAGNMFCLKSIAEIVKRNATTGSLRPWSDFWTTFEGRLSWTLVFGAVFFAVSNVHYMTKGMRAYETLFMVTVYEGSNILVNSASAIIVLNEMSGAPWWKDAGYLLCIVVIVFALAILVGGEKVLRKDSETDLFASLLSSGTNSSGNIWATAGSIGPPAASAAATIERHYSPPRPRPSSQVAPT